MLAATYHYQRVLANAEGTTPKSIADHAAYAMQHQTMAKALQNQEGARSLHHDPQANIAQETYTARQHRRTSDTVISNRARGVMRAKDPIRPGPAVQQQMEAVAGSVGAEAAAAPLSLDDATVPQLLEALFLRAVHAGGE